MLGLFIFIFYIVAAGFTFKIMLGIKEYDSWDGIVLDHKDENPDRSRIVFGTIFWPVTALLYAGVVLARKLTEKNENKEM